MLMAQPAVRLMSQNLLEITRDFSLSQILLFDRHGTSLADSNFDTEFSPIGGNYKTRTYFTEALDQGVEIDADIAAHKAKAKTPKP